MDAGDHIVESCKDLVGIIERTVGQDVAFGPLEESELARTSRSGSIRAH